MCPSDSVIGLLYSFQTISVFKALIRDIEYFPLAAAILDKISTSKFVYGLLPRCSSSWIVAPMRNVEYCSTPFRPFKKKTLCLL